MDEGGAERQGARGRARAVGPIRRWARRVVRVVFWALAGAAVLTLVARGASGTAWQVDMVATFAAQEAAAALAVGLVALAVFRVWGAGGVLVAVGLIHYGWLAMGRAPHASAKDVERGAPVRVMTFNYLGANAKTEPFMEYLLGCDADVVVVLETPQKLWMAMQASEALRERFPYQSLPRRGFWVNRIKLSRWPMQDLDLVDRTNPPERFEFSLTGSALVRHPEAPFILTAMLPISPRSASDWADGNAEIRKSGTYIRERVMSLNYPVIVCMDTNATPSGFRTRLLRRVVGLRRTKPLGVFRGTWPSRLAPVARVAIDDVVVSQEISVRSWRTVEGFAFGSDHVPVVAEIVVPSVVERGAGGGAAGEDGGGGQ